MDVAMLYHSISNILRWKNSLKPLAKRLTGIDINQIETILIEINEKVQTGRSDWLQKVKDVVIDFNDLMEDLCRKEGIGGLNLNDRFKATLQVKKATGELKSLLNDKEAPKGAEPPAAAAATANTDDDRRKSAYDKFEESIKSAVFGRENEKNEIIDQLLKPNNSDAVPVVIMAIFGVPGIGKTKLANLVCKDERVKAHFGFQLTWINDLQILNETFDVKSIAKRVTTTDSKRLLLFIDDLRVGIEDGHLEKLQKKLTGAVNCTHISMLVTTRSNHVANSIAAAGGHVLNLQGLNQDESRSLFQRVNEPNTALPEPKIVKDCSGVPLLILIIATLMKNHGGDSILQEKAAATLTIEDMERKFLQELEFFYYGNLPTTHQKLCFAYCSLFAEDYLIDADRLIQLWSAEGFLTIHSDKIPEQQFGRACFDYFVPLLFHQVEEENKYRMNPLMHKLAKQVATNCGENIIVERKFLRELEFFYYGNLPTHQKLCFAYCSLFAEDYLIDADRLIQLWSAEGFLTIHSDKIPEQQFGRACFDYFVPLLFHQVEEENKYRMNPLMHKLAKQVATNCGENIIVDSMGERVHSRMLRALFDYPIDMLCGIPDSMFEQAKKLRTILLPYNSNNPRLPRKVRITTSTCEKIFNNFISLRVLDMHDLGIKTVPSSIEEVKYLRYLDLSNNNMEKLPSCITNLIHLQTLKLSQCHVLKELPKDIGDLSSLNHLDIEGCLDLTHLPSGINKLTSLQTLSLFVASKKQVTGGLKSLTDLNNLRGHLEVSHLEQVKFSPSKEAAKDEFLKNKQHLEFLTLRWDHDEEDEDESDVDKDMKSLECLQPHEKLRVLLIVGYNGLTLSNWFDSLQCLVKFTLNDCPKCEFLPPMDHLPHLKVLQLRRLDSLTFIAENNQVGSSTPIFFPSLKELTIADCPKLKSWWKKEIQGNYRPFFKCISKLNIQYCPLLACMPLYPDLDEELILVKSNVKSMTDTMNTKGSQSQPFSKLRYMVIERIEDSPPESWLKNFISLEELHIRDCSNFKSLPQGFKSLSSLKSLSIEKCEELVLDLDKSGTKWDQPTEWEGLENLSFLTLRSIPKLKSLPWGVENVKSLKDLRIYDCKALISLPESIGNLTSLEKLVISECRELDSLPKGMANLSKLHTLNIMDCPLLLPRCQPDTGDDWPQIAHIINKSVTETPRDFREL